MPPNPSFNSSRAVVVPAVSASLLIALGLGLFEAVLLSAGAGPVLGVMGVPGESAMAAPALQYLSVRALGAPAFVLSLAAQGVFRGFKDTKTPLVASVTGNALNIFLVPLLTVGLGWGVRGAAVANVIAQCTSTAFLLLRLNQRVVLVPPDLSALKFERFLKSGGLLLGRTLALLSTMTLATAMAARQGAASMAAHQIALQIWLAASLLSDSVALAAQTLLASAFASGDSRRVRQIANRTLQIGMAMGLVTASCLALSSSSLPSLFSTDPAVIAAIAPVMPFVAATQPITSLAFVFDGLHYGASDFAYSAYAMILLSLPVAAMLLVAPNYWGISGIWAALTLTMAGRMFCGFLRVGTGSGPWHAFRERRLGLGELSSLPVPIESEATKETTWTA